MADLGTGIGLGTSLIGGLMGSDAADDAADMQYAASQRAIDEQRRQYDQTRTDMAPWREAGTNALSRLQGLMENGMMTPFTGENLREEPGYQFGLDEGNKGIQNAMAARGMLNSGATGKALQRFGQDYAGTKYNEAFNRDQATKSQQYNMLAGLSGSGQTAANQVANYGMNTANNVANIGMSGANALAAGRVGSTNALTGAMDDIGGYYRLQNLLKG